MSQTINVAVAVPKRKPVRQGQRTTGNHAARAMACRTAGVANTGRQWRKARKAARRVTE